MVTIHSQPTTRLITFLCSECCREHGIIKLRPGESYTMMPTSVMPNCCGQPLTIVQTIVPTPPPPLADDHEPSMELAEIWTHKKLLEEYMAVRETLARYRRALAWVCKTYPGRPISVKYALEEGDRGNGES